MKTAVSLLSLSLFGLAHVHARGGDPAPAPRADAPAAVVHGHCSVHDAACPSAPRAVAGGLAVGPVALPAAPRAPALLRVPAPPAHAPQAVRVAPDVRVGVVAPRAQAGVAAPPAPPARVSVVGPRGAVVVRGGGGEVRVLRAGDGRVVLDGSACAEACEEDAEACDELAWELDLDDLALEIEDGVREAFAELRIDGSDWEDLAEDIRDAVEDATVDWRGFLSPARGAGGVEWRCDEPCCVERGARAGRGERSPRPERAELELRIAELQDRASDEVRRGMEMARRRLAEERDRLAEVQDRAAAEVERAMEHAHRRLAEARDKQAAEELAVRERAAAQEAPRADRRAEEARVGAMDELRSLVESMQADIDALRADLSALSERVEALSRREPH